MRSAFLVSAVLLGFVDLTYSEESKSGSSRHVSKTPPTLIADVGQGPADYLFEHISDVDALQQETFYIYEIHNDSMNGLLTARWNEAGLELFRVSPNKKGGFSIPGESAYIIERNASIDYGEALNHKKVAPLYLQKSSSSANVDDDRRTVAPTEERELTTTIFADLNHGEDVIHFTFVSRAIGGRLQYQVSTHGRGAGSQLLFAVPDLVRRYPDIAKSAWKTSDRVEQGDTFVASREPITTLASTFAREIRIAHSPIYLLRQGTNEILARARVAAHVEAPRR